MPSPGPFDKLREIRAGYWHLCLRDASDQAHCWGGNDSGQLGIGKGNDWSDDTRADPAAVVQSWKQTHELCAGGMNIRPDGRYRRPSSFAESGITCALSESDEVFCWGEPDLDYTPKKILVR